MVKSRDTVSRIGELFAFGMGGEQIGTIPLINYSCSDERRRNRRPSLCGGPTERQLTIFGGRKEANKHSSSNIALNSKLVPASVQYTPQLWNHPRHTVQIPIFGSAIDCETSVATNWIVSPPLLIDHFSSSRI
jgi:hypothetical protein